MIEVATIYATIKGNSIKINLIPKRDFLEKPSVSMTPKSGLYFLKIKFKIGAVKDKTTTINIINTNINMLYPITAYKILFSFMTVDTWILLFPNKR